MSSSSPMGKPAISLSSGNLRRSSSRKSVLRSSSELKVVPQTLILFSLLISSLFNDFPIATLCRANALDDFFIFEFFDVVANSCFYDANGFGPFEHRNIGYGSHHIQDF